MICSPDVYWGELHSNIQTVVEWIFYKDLLPPVLLEPNSDVCLFKVSPVLFDASSSDVEHSCRLNYTFLSHKSKMEQILLNQAKESQWYQVTGFFFLLERKKKAILPAFSVGWRNLSSLGSYLMRCLPCSKICHFIPTHALVCSFNLLLLPICLFGKTSFNWCSCSDWLTK